MTAEREVKDFARLEGAIEDGAGWEGAVPVELGSWAPLRRPPYADRAARDAAAAQCSRRPPHPDAGAFDGAVALVVPGPEGDGRGYRFEDWRVTGDRGGYPRVRLGPVMFVHYT